MAHRIITIKLYHLLIKIVYHLLFMKVKITQINKNNVTKPKKYNILYTLVSMISWLQTFKNCFYLFWQKFHSVLYTTYNILPEKFGNRMKC